MNNSQFIAKQRVKYYWKSLKHTARLARGDKRDEQGASNDAFWDYEQTPRNF